VGCPDNRSMQPCGWVRCSRQRSVNPARPGRTDLARDQRSATLMLVPFQPLAPPAHCPIRSPQNFRRRPPRDLLGHRLQQTSCTFIIRSIPAAEYCWGCDVVRRTPASDSAARQTAVTDAGTMTPVRSETTGHFISKRRRSIDGSVSRTVGFCAKCKRGFHPYLAWAGRGLQRSSCTGSGQNVFRRP
jgi:hypothetical protein